MSSIPSSSKTSSRPADAFGSQQTVDNAVHHTALLAQRDGKYAPLQKLLLFFSLTRSREVSFIE